MAEIHAPVIAADINDDGKIEMVTADVHGNVAAWTAGGEEIWEVHLKSLIPQASSNPFLLWVLTDCVYYIFLVVYLYLNIPLPLAVYGLQIATCPEAACLFSSVEYYGIFLVRLSQFISILFYYLFTESEIRIS